MEKVKQVIIIRKDLNMRKGKMVAQGSHASMSVILNMMKKSKRTEYIPTETHGYYPVEKFGYHLEFDEKTPLDEWLNGRFTKVCLSCDSEEELIKLYEQAKESNLPCVLITDAGLTEFNGVPTKTCIAIGPAYSEDIDKITSHLKLL